MSNAGRPEVGTPINVRLGNELLTQVDTYAEAEVVSRAEAIRQLVQRGLPRRRKAKAAPTPALRAELLRLGNWLDRAREEVEEVDPADKCDYEAARAYHWLNYLEGMVDIKRRGIEANTQEPTPMTDDGSTVRPDELPGYAICAAQ
jgi:Arc/MetJ-type ribon-helix-helix transcriptional regulator